MWKTILGFMNKTIMDAFHLYCILPDKCESTNKFIEMFRIDVAVFESSH